MSETTPPYVTYNKTSKWRCSNCKHELGDCDSAVG